MRLAAEQALTTPMLVQRRMLALWSESSVPAPLTTLTGGSNSRFAARSAASRPPQ